MKKWQQAEKRDAKTFGTTQQRGSGNQDHYPSDSFSDSLIIETKQTDKASYSITLERWQKLLDEAAVLDAKDKRLRIPIMSLHIQNKHLVVIEAEDFNHIMQIYDSPKV